MTIPDDTSVYLSDDAGKPQVSDTERFLTALTNGAYGLIGISSILRSGRVITEWPESPAEAAEVAARLDANPESIGSYFRTGLVDEEPPYGRGKAQDTTVVLGFCIDLDVAGPHHKTDAKLPETLAQAFGIIRASPLPEPSAIVFTGGGLHAHYLLDKPALISEHGYAKLAAIAVGVQDALGAAAARLGGYHVDKVGSLAQLMRLPGTWNRKCNCETRCDPVDARLIEFQPDLRYSLEEITDLVPPVEIRQPVNRTDDGWKPDPERGRPLDALSLALDVGDWLEHVGWTYVGRDSQGNDQYLRPGSPSSLRSAVVYADNPYWVQVYSDGDADIRANGYSVGGLIAAKHYTDKRHLAGDLNAYVDGVENTRIEEILAAFPDVLEDLKANVKPMTKAAGDAGEETENHHDGLRLVFGDSQMQAASWMWDETRDVGGVAGFLAGSAKLLPRSELCLLAGREGLGKSTMACHIAAKVSTGTLPGEFYGEPRAVVYHTTEDHWNVTVVPRLVAAGADMDHVAYVKAGPEGFNFPDDIPQLGTLCEQERVALIVLDPLSTLIRGDLNTWKDSDARKALEPLTKMAHERDVTVLGLAHFKKGEGDALDKVMGTKAFVAVARSVLAVAEEPRTEGEEPPTEGGGEPRFLFGQIKNNLGPMARHARRYSITAAALGEYEGKPINTSKIVWGSMTDHDIKHVIADANQRARVKKANVRDRATEWLVARLQGGPVPKKTLIAEAKPLGITEITLQRARDGLISEQIETVQLGGRGKPVAWKWIMPTHEHQWEE